MAQLHIDNIDQGFLPILGPRFLSLLYRVIDESQDGTLLLAHEKDQVVGFIAGTVDIWHIYRRLLRYCPSLLFSLSHSVLIPSRLWQIIEILRYSRVAGCHVTAGFLPHAELLSIVVDPSFRGLGHSDKLYATLASFFASRGVEEFKITVGSALEPAHRFYRRMGATPQAKLEVHKGSPSTVYVQKVSDLSRNAIVGYSA